MKALHDAGHEVSLGGLADLSPDEMSHMAAVCHRQQGPVSEQALRDCITTIQREFQAGTVETEDDLMRLRNKMKERKGIRE